jgi:hypothetical protein
MLAELALPYLGALRQQNFAAGKQQQRANAKIPEILAEGSLPDGWWTDCKNSLA